MTDRQVNQWRTVGAALLACAMLLGGFIAAIVLATPSGGVLPLGDADGMFGDLSDAVVWLVVAVATKAGIEHLGKGRGLPGAKAALFTDERPGAPK